jgi:hypothetical protein
MMELGAASNGETVETSTPEVRTMGLNNRGSKHAPAVTTQGKIAIALTDREGQVSV